MSLPNKPEESNRNESCVHCPLSKRVANAMYERLVELDGLMDYRMPERLLQAYEDHTGISWYHGPLDENGTPRPTGREPTNELCSSCFTFQRTYYDFFMSLRA